EPKIWRRIQVPSKYSFWDLHVAIQDSMGWIDYHLHAFRVRMPHKRKIVEIGIPTDDYFDEPVLPGWQIPITDYFTEPGKSAPYEYDFGDGWEHNILLEGILLKEKGARYPKCVAGERACPPEDCGGLPGYYELVEILKNPKHPEFRDHIGWLKGHAKNYYPYEPDQFNPEKVEFWNPKKRWKIAFS
ncbi:MAG: plasmid pRiA4b ORF-3 family protein, partial [Desulfobacterales bacterium]